MWLVSILLAALAQNPTDTADVWAKEIAKQIEAHEFEPALEKATLALEYFPEDAALLELASQAALENGDKDVALWYAQMALERVSVGVDLSAKELPPKVVELQKRVADLDPLGGRSASLVGSYRDTLLAVGKSIGKRKLYVNAVDLLTKSRDLGLDALSEAELAKIYDNKKAVEALLDSGLDVPLKSKKKKRTPEQIAKEDAKHVEWDQAYEIKGDNYTVRTDMGGELAESMSQAMELMNAFYRQVFHVKERGGKTARVTISVYKNRAEFDAHESKPDKNVLGFFRPGANVVATFDPREYGFALSELWSTLFHESSHQFTHLISADLIPAWLNEGTASYFEGARLRQNGSVETNLVPEGRLVDLEAELKAGKPTLKDVVSFFEPGSYPGDYYAFGWGLVYFLLNYENDKCERVYVEPYQEYMAAYGSGGKHDVFGRFCEYFVDKPKQPGIKTFEDFEKRWSDWIVNLHALYFGPASKADELLARARKQVVNKKLDAAVESYRWALRKRPLDTLAYFELGDVLLAQKKEDAALFNYRRALASARAVAEADKPLGAAGSATAKQVIERCGAQIEKLDEEFGKAFAAADAKLLDGASAAAKEYVEKEFPLAALTVLDRTREAGGGSAELAGLRAKIASDANVDTARWRRPRLVPPLDDWQLGKEWKIDAGALACASEGPSMAIQRGALPERYRVEFELKIEKLGDQGFVALLFGVGENALQYFGVDGRGLVEIGRRTKEWTPTVEIGLIEKKQLEKLHVALDVTPEKVEFILGERSVAEQVYSPDELAGALGFVVQGAQARIEDLRVRY